MPYAAKSSTTRIGGSNWLVNWAVELVVETACHGVALRKEAVDQPSCSRRALYLLAQVAAGCSKYPAPH